MDEIIGLILLIAGSAAGVIALLTLTPFLLPDKTARSRRVIEATPGRAFIIGLVNFLFFSVIAAIISQGGDAAGLIGLTIVLALAALAAVGLGGLVLLLRERIYPEPAAGLRRTVYTAALLTLGTLLPFVGWFIFAPILLLISLGAAIMVVVRRKGGTTDLTDQEDFHG
ncbi:MAG TPA: hypothetical protein ENK32_06830 [Anaerolineae bacterium]|nr:hypothetical protein [Anaerolineae bacterium]